MKRFLKSWSLLCRLAVNDFKAKYAGSSLGVVWAIAEPLVTVVIYWFVYTVAFGKNTGEIPYYLWLCAGIAPWFFISDGLRGMTSAYVDYSYLVKKMTFDNSVIPRARMLSSLISHLVFLAIVLILCIIDGSVRIDAASLIFMIFVSSFFVLSVGNITSVLCAKHKDVSNIIGILLNIGFWVTPIFWNAGGIGGRLNTMIMLNPVAIIISGYRKAVLYGGYLTGGEFIYLICVCVAIFVLSHFLKRRYLPTIADNL